MNVKTISCGTLAAAATFATAMFAVSPAQAATFTFDFRKQQPAYPTAPSFTFSQTVGSETLSVTAEGIGLGTTNVYQGISGLGVISNNTNDSQQLDGLDFLEKLRLTFSPGVRLLSASFGRVGLDDDFTLDVQGINRLTNKKIPGGLSTDNGQDPGTSVDFVSVSSPYYIPKSYRTGTIFDFGTNDRTDDYFLSKVSVATVPTPALLPGLLGLGVAALRKRKANAAAATEAES